jgi:hypothetical protein
MACRDNRGVTNVEIRCADNHSKTWILQYVSGVVRRPDEERALLNFCAPLPKHRRLCSSRARRG